MASRTSEAPLLEGVYDADGDIVEGNHWWAACRNDVWHELTFTVPADGSYYIAVASEAFPAGLGSHVGGLTAGGAGADKDPNPRPGDRGDRQAVNVLLVTSIPSQLSQLNPDSDSVRASGGGIKRSSPEQTGPAMKSVM